MASAGRRRRSALSCSRPQVLALNVSLSFHVAPFPSRCSDVAEIELLTDTLSRRLRGPFVTERAFLGARSAWTALLKQPRPRTFCRELIRRVPQRTYFDRQASAPDAIAKPIAELGEFPNAVIQF